MLDELKKINKAYPYFCYYNNNHYNYGFSSKVIAGNKAVSSFLEVQNCINNQHFIGGFLSYELKNSFEKLSSPNIQSIPVPSLFFFHPKLEIYPNKNLKIDEKTTKLTPSAVRLHPLYTKEEYIQRVNTIKEHIQRGDIYETNFCIEFVVENVTIDPIDLYNSLNSLSPMPFSALFKYNSIYILSASPERFLKKINNKLISQPIKGTIKRGNTYEEDEKLKVQLLQDPKERSENVMIVDLVRNDLSTLCIPGTVNVSELFGIYTFPKVHQMISTIEGELEQPMNFQEIIKKTFPMGSMTGAPKIRAMELMSEFEKTSRGIYSGSIGYIDSEGNFDFNVVIRSLIYDTDKRKISFHVGSAITIDAVAEKEYEECLLKASTMLTALGLEAE